MRAAGSRPHLRRRALAALAGLLLAPLPLVGVWGYESGLILAPLLSVLAAFDGVDRARAARGQGGMGPRDFTNLALDPATLWLTAAAGLGAAPLLQRVCDPLGGLALFALGPGVSAILGWVCGLWGGTLGASRRRAVGLALLPMLASTLVALVRLYRDPAIFAYDPFWGRFAGAIYDEHVAASSIYLWYRAYNVLAASGAIALWVALVDPALVRLRPVRSWPALTLATLLVLGALTIGLTPDRHGFHATRASLARALPMSRRTPHFVIHFAPRTATHREIEAVAAEHELAWDRLAAALGRAPRAPIHSYVFPSADAKRAAMGAGRVEVAPPWRGELYLHYAPYPHPSLFHELAHAFEITLGDPWFGVSRHGLHVNMGLVEGLATALAKRPVDRLDLHDQAAVLDRLGKRPPLAGVFGPRFWAHAGRHAYTAAGSFVRFLIDRDGMDAVIRLYASGGRFQEVLATPLADLEREWVTMLRARDLPEDVLAAQAERFRARPIFARPCAHRIARVVREIQRARARGADEQTLERFDTLCALEPEQPSHRLGLADELARQGHHDRARAVLIELRGRDDLTSGLRAAIDERLGYLALAEGDLDAARAAFERGLSLPVPEAQARALTLGRVAASDPQLAPLVDRYVGRFERRDDGLARSLVRLHSAHRIAALPEHHALGTYLVARQLAAVQAHDLAARAFASSLADPGVGLPDKRFIRAARLGLLAAQAASGDLLGARRTLADLRTGGLERSGDQALLRRWAARLDELERCCARAGGGLKDPT